MRILGRQKVNGYYFGFYWTVTACKSIGILYESLAFVFIMSIHSWNTCKCNCKNLSLTYVLNQYTQIHYDFQFLPYCVIAVIMPKWIPLQERSRAGTVAIIGNLYIYVSANVRKMHDQSYFFSLRIKHWKHWWFISDRVDKHAIWMEVQFLL